MITQSGITQGYSKKDLQGLSTDTKPVINIGNGSTFIELDTSKVWLYDAENVNIITTNGWWEI